MQKDLNGGSDFLERIPRRTSASCERGGKLPCPPSASPLKSRRGIIASE